MTEVVVECAQAWGRGHNLEDAVFNLFRNYYDDPPEDGLKVQMWRVSGYQGGSYGEVDADEIHEHTVFDVDPEIVEDLEGFTTDFVIAVESGFQDAVNKQ